jgi:EpsI family protein
LPLDWWPTIAGPTRSFSEVYVNGSAKIDRFVALYAVQGRTSNFVNTSNRDADERDWSFDSARNGVLLVDGRSVPVRVSRWLRGQEHRTVWSFYVIGGRVAPNALIAKWEQLRSYVTGNRCLSAYVAFSIAGTQYQSSPKAVNSLLAASQPLGSYLCRSTKGRAPR